MKIDLKMIHSAGIIIQDSKTAKFLAAHTTGTPKTKFRYDILKGQIEDGEDAIDAAIREAKEESGLTISKNQIAADYGVFQLREDKDLHLFFVTMPIDVKSLKCTSTFVDRYGRNMPELNEFILVDDFDYYHKSLGQILKKIFNK